MQFRTLSVAMAVLAVVVVVMAADPAPSADVLHAKCYHNDGKHWHIAGEDLDEEAMKTVPQEYSAMGWRKWKSGKCSYKSRHVDCPNKWWGDENQWDKHYGYKKLYHVCTEDSQCCNHNCLKVEEDGTKKCCPIGKKAWNVSVTTASDCCSKNAKNETGGSTPPLYCIDPTW
jgi:hypothetical protein